MNGETPATGFEINSQFVRENRAAFALDGVTAVSLVGLPGTGKTTLIEAVAGRLQESMRIAAVIGNSAATREADRLTRLGVNAVAVQTDRLTAADVNRSLSSLNLSRTDLLFIESSAAGAPGADFEFGQDLRVAVFSTTGGDRKAAEYAGVVGEADLVLLAKIDLQPYVGFDVKAFCQDVGRIRAGIKTLNVSGRTGDGIEDWVTWLAGRWSPDKRYLNVERKRKADAAFG
jgi:hydrogenase nickel incorporation protein HypB